MAYCSNCGTPYEIGESKYCSKCGLSLVNVPNKKRYSIWHFIVLFLLIVAVIIGPFLFNWIFGECGPLNVARATQEFDSYSTHLINLETASQNYNRPPSYLLSQIDADILSLSNRRFDYCIQPTANAMESALISSYNYFSYQSEESGSPGNAENRYQYESDLRTYYQELDKLHACQPLCNFTIQK